MRKMSGLETKLWGKENMFISKTKTTSIFYTTSLCQDFKYS